MAETINHAPAKPPPRGDLNMPLIMTLAICGTLVTLALILGIQAWFHSQLNTELAQKSLAQANWELQDLRAAQLQRIQTYRWVDQNQQVVAIPVDRAMELLAAEGRKR